jgi:predicted RNA binding protein YcfA (HicA-like mRNA interferase family)
MHKLPRDMKGTELAQALARIGYRTDRQTGSHMRLTAKDKRGEHHVTIPALNGILADIAARLGIDRESLLKRLFG